jgi:hypothetical protein
MVNAVILAVFLFQVTGQNSLDAIDQLLLRGQYSEALAQLQSLPAIE